MLLFSVTAAACCLPKTPQAPADGSVLRVPDAPEMGVAELAKGLVYTIVIRYDRKAELRVPFFAERRRDCPSISDAVTVTIG